MRFSRNPLRQNYSRERVAPPHRVKVTARAPSWLNLMGEIGWQRPDALRLSRKAPPGEPPVSKTRRKARVGSTWSVCRLGIPPAGGLFGCLGVGGNDGRCDFIAGGRCGRCKHAYLATCRVRSSRQVRTCLKVYYSKGPERVSSSDGPWTFVFPCCYSPSCKHGTCERGNTLAFFRSFHLSVKRASKRKLRS
jgi:hypothetical protein